MSVNVEYDSDEEESAQTGEEEEGYGVEMDEKDKTALRKRKEREQVMSALRKTVYASKDEEDTALSSPVSRRQKGTLRLAKIEVPLNFSFRVSSALMGTVRNSVLGPSHVVIDDACLYYCTHAVHDTKVWTRLPLIVPDAGCDFIVIAIKRSVGAVVFARCYALSLDDVEECTEDSAGNGKEESIPLGVGAPFGSAAMATDAMSFDDTHVVVVVAMAWAGAMVGRPYRRAATSVSLLQRPVMGVLTIPGRRS